MSKRIHIFILLVFAFLWAVTAIAQTIDPVIVEYKGKGEGKFEVTNNTLSPMVVVFEPKSFRITPQGMGIYRPLDPSIHVELSAMSARLQPKQSYYVFYKAHADTLPAWFTIYAVFSPAKRGPGVNIRIMLPHTVYLYSKSHLLKQSVQVKNAVYLPDKNLVDCDIENTSNSLGRIREGNVIGGKGSILFGGFPMLPGSPRHIEIAWKEKTPPEFIVFHFDHFAVKERLSGPNR